MKTYDAIVIGAGFYGCAIALYLKKTRGINHIAILERESTLMQRASLHNQARVHNGYHYPRSFLTAYRSRINYPKFINHWPSVIQTNLQSIYAIARHQSKVSARQFANYCHEIGANIKTASLNQRKLFNFNLIENIYLVDEHVFDSTKLAKQLKDDLAQMQIPIFYNLEVGKVAQDSDNYYLVMEKSKQELCLFARSRYLFNCTYAGINQFSGDIPKTKTILKHEIAEIILIRPPESLEHLAITIMDGPFFSMLPYPACDLYSLSHVRYTPHTSWIDNPYINPYAKLQSYQADSRYNRMIRDSARYLPCMSKATLVQSFYEVKTLLINNEIDDGRPILFEKNTASPGYYSILGGKIDNIFDAFDRLDEERF